MFKDTLFFEDSKNEKDYDAFVDTVRIYFQGKVDIHVPIEFLTGTNQEFEYLMKIMEKFNTSYTMNNLEEFVEDKTVTAVSMERKIILCYDGVRKFNEKRKKSLENYPEEMEFSYPLGYWKKKCQEIDFRNPRAITDAMVDSYVDILGESMGYQVIRIQQGEFQWTKNGSVQLLEKLIKNASSKEFQKTE